MLLICPNILMLILFLWMYLLLKAAITKTNFRINLSSKMELPFENLDKEMLVTQRNKLIKYNQEYI